jgi:hypothetical protein
MVSDIKWLWDSYYLLHPSRPVIKNRAGDLPGLEISLIGFEAALKEVGHSCSLVPGAIPPEEYYCSAKRIL